MRTTIDELLLALSATVEQLELESKKLKLKEKVDVGARLGAAIKAAEAVQTKIKDELKKQWDGKPILGAAFTAEVLRVDVTRFDTKTFKEERPKLYDAYTVTDTQIKLTFKIR